MSEFEQLKQSLSEEPASQLSYKRAAENSPIHPYTPTWEIGITPYIRDNTVSLQLHGWEIVLLSDGTYFINDTSGG